VNIWKILLPTPVMRHKASHQVLQGIVAQRRAVAAHQRFELATHSRRPCACHAGFSRDLRETVEAMSQEEP
jgi:hypothetical protein